jgi:hypothetical protein
MSEKIKVTIDRARWRTGINSTNATGTGDTELLNQEGYMCCLGFICKAVGIRDAAISGVSTPLNVCLADKEAEKKIGSLVQLGPWRTLVNSGLSRDAMHINDYRDTTPDQKEEKLLELFKDSEFEIEFTGEYKEKLNG